VAGAGGGPYDPAAMIAPLARLERFHLSGLDRYILRQCLSVTLFVTAALSAAVWLAQSLRLIDLIVNRGLSAEVFLYLALLILPRFIDIVLPIGAFVAVLFVFNKLSAESELVVMRASGLSPVALAKPVMLLAAIGFIVLMSLSAYFLPASNREFKDLQFEIRNRFVSSLLQEGTFTTISDKLTIYIGARNERGEISGVLINDERDPQQPVTIFAERGAFADSAEGSRIILVNGNRQRYERASGKLSVLTFDRYTLDLAMLRDAPVVRFREAQERFLGELFFPPADLDATNYRNFIVEAHQRLTIPLSIFSFVMIPLACLLPGEFNRRGQLKRVLLAVFLALVFQSTDLGVKNLAASHYAAIPLMYVIDLLPLALGFGMLLFGGIRFGLWRPAAAGEPA
jgi:lipopolysaccharide export system permease protein